MAINNLFECPLPAALPVVPDQACSSESGNVISLALQLQQAAPSFSNTGPTDIKLLATWTPLIASTTATAIRILPVTNFQIPAGEAIARGGNDNTTFGGVPMLQHGSYATATCTLEGATPATAQLFRDMTKFSKVMGGRTRLRAFLLHDTDLIGSALDYNGVEVYGFYVSDLNKSGEYRVEDQYQIQFYLRYGWSSKYLYSKAAFDLSSLKNA